MLRWAWLICFFFVAPPQDSCFPFTRTNPFWADSQFLRATFAELRALSCLIPDTSSLQFASTARHLQPEDPIPHLSSVAVIRLACFDSTRIEWAFNFDHATSRPRSPEDPHIWHREPDGCRRMNMHAEFWYFGLVHDWNFFQFTSKRFSR